MKFKLSTVLVTILLICLPSLQAQTTRIFGNSRLMENESLFFLKEKEGDAPESRLLFPATHIRLMTNLAGDVAYEEGKDFTLGPDNVTVALTPTSRIPYYLADDLFVKPNAKNGIGYKLGDPNTWVLWSENFLFQEAQCSVTYEHAPDMWKGYLPGFSNETLPRTIDKLRKKESITIGVTGDSISAGANATGLFNHPPFKRTFYQQTVDNLQVFYGGEVVLKNHAVPGWSAGNGLKDLPNLLTDKPDLIFIAYGMNDVSGNDPNGYRTNVKAIIDQIHLTLSQTEIILVASMMGNPNWCATPPERFPAYRDQLKTLAGPGCAFLDMTSVWEELLKHKTYSDITGNGVNHPNDFCHRVYAEMISRLLIPME